MKKYYHYQNLNGVNITLLYFDGTRTALDKLIDGFEFETVKFKMKNHLITHVTLERQPNETITLEPKEYLLRFKTDTYDKIKIESKADMEIKYGNEEERKAAQREIGYRYLKDYVKATGIRHHFDNIDTSKSIDIQYRIYDVDIFVNELVKLNDEIYDNPWNLKLYDGPMIKQTLQIYIEKVLNDYIYMWQTIEFPGAKTIPKETPDWLFRLPD